MLKTYFVPLLILVIALVASCGEAEPDAVPASVSTQALTLTPAPPPNPTSTPVLTPTPTDRSIPSPTSVPTQAPTSAPTPSPAPTLTQTTVPTLHPTDTSSPPLMSATDSTPLIEFPIDESAHDVPIEWWYFNGHLADSEGHDYSFHFVGVKASASKVLQGRVMNLTLATPRQGVVVKAEQVALGKGEHPPTGFSMVIDDWCLEGADEQYVLQAADGKYGLSLRLEETKSPVLHGEDGIIDMGPAGESYYYSRTRLKGQGTLTIEGAPLNVFGEAWMDHQWGDFGQERVRWNWFSLQLNDNSELMVVLFWDITTRKLILQYGTYLPPLGTAQYLQWEDIEVTPVDSWTSPNTAITYDMGWQLEVTPMGLSIKVEPVHLDAEFHGSQIRPLVYWEGAAIVSGQKGGEAISGRGYVEMGGYGDKRP